MKVIKQGLVVVVMVVRDKGKARNKLPVTTLAELLMRRTISQKIKKHQASCPHEELKIRKRTRKGYTYIYKERGK